jgi:hypothetical protein
MPDIKVFKRIKTDFDAIITFSIDDDGQREIRLELPDVVNKKWDFRSDKDEISFARLVSNIAIEYIHKNEEKKETVGDLVELLKNGIEKGYIVKVEN